MKGIGQFLAHNTQICFDRRCCGFQLQSERKRRGYGMIVRRTSMPEEHITAIASLVHRARRSHPSSRRTDAPALDCLAASLLPSVTVAFVVPGQMPAMACRVIAGTSQQPLVHPATMRNAAGAGKESPARPGKSQVEQRATGGRWQMASKGGWMKCSAKVYSPSMMILDLGWWWWW